MAYWLAQQPVTTKVRVPFLGRQNVRRPIIFDIVNFCYKLMMEKTKGIFAVSVVWCVSYASAKN